MKGFGGTHNKLVEYINNRLMHSSDHPYGFPFYDYINKEQIVKKDGQTLMEVDNYAIRKTHKGKTYLLLFEDKSSDYKNRDKALSQLERECENCDRILKLHGLKNKDVRVFKFYVHNHEHPKIEWVNQSYITQQELLDGLKHVQKVKQNDCYDTYLTISMAFQNTFLEKLQTLNFTRQGKVLNKYFETYNMKRKE